MDAMQFTHKHLAQRKHPATILNEEAFMKNKIIVPIFIVLFLLGAVPFAFTEENASLLFGWLPVPLAF